METQIIEQSAQVRYAGFWTRFAAYLIDCIILAVVGIILGFVFGLVGILDDSEAADQALNLISLVISAGYFIHFHSSEKMATLGKQALGIKVVNAENHERITQINALGRYAGLYLSSFILMIGYIMAAFTKKKQALHDMLAGTVVIYK